MILLNLNLPRAFIIMLKKNLFNLFLLPLQNHNSANEGGQNTHWDNHVLNFIFIYGKNILINLTHVWAQLLSHLIGKSALWTYLFVYTGDSPMPNLRGTPRFTSTFRMSLCFRLRLPLLRKLVSIGHPYRIRNLSLWAHRYGWEL